MFRALFRLSSERALFRIKEELYAVLDVQVGREIGKLVIIVNCQVLLNDSDSIKTAMRRLTTAIRSDKRVVRRFCRCANAIKCTYTNLDSIAYCTPSLYGIAYCC